MARRGRKKGLEEDEEKSGMVHPVCFLATTLDTTLVPTGDICL
jgi:hypothetical protein